MKKLILLATSVSFLCAGPMVKPLVDYDKADVIEAETKVEQKLVLPLAEPPVVTTPGVRKKAFRYEADLLAGRNWSDDDSVLKDANTFGIRLNRFITDDVAIQIGYDRIFDADYKFGKKSRTLRNNSGQSETTPNCPEGYCCACVPCPDEGGNEDTTDANQGNTDNGDQNGGDNIDDGNQGYDDYDNGTNNGTGGNELPGGDDGMDHGAGEGDNTGNGGGSDDHGNGAGGNGAGGNGAGSGNGGMTPGGGTTTPPLSNKGLYSSTRSTDVDRFYINALKEVHSEKTRLIPFFFAGLGYEHVNDKNLGIDSQGFFNAGGGLKYKLGEKFRLVSEAKAIKKFKDDDIDIVAMLGLGMLFGQIEEAPQQQTPDVEENVEPKPQQQDLSLILLDEQPLAKNEVSPAVTAPNLEAIVAEQESTPAPAVPAIEDNAYYIQVAVVTTEKGMQSYLDRLRASNLPYTTKTVKVKNKEGHRILAGPYLSRAEAAADLKRVKRIEKGAFIKKL